MIGDVCNITKRVVGRGRAGSGSGKADGSSINLERAFRKVPPSRPACRCLSTSPSRSISFFIKHQSPMMHDIRIDDTWII